MSYTQGPWYTRHNQISSLESTHGCTIANCNSTSRGIPDEEVQANARLIASAPDLYEALTQLLDRLAEFGNIDIIREEEPIENARQAVAKVKYN
jgi:hypothetical protein